MAKLSGGLKDAFNDYDKNGTEDTTAGPDNEPKESGEDGKVEAVHYHSHKGGKMHSKHEIHGDGTATSSSHGMGEGGDCPMCGGGEGGGVH